jgi:hypothetical protein
VTLLGRIVTLVVVLMTLAGPLAAQSPSPSEPRVGVQRLPAGVGIGTPVPGSWKGVKVLPTVEWPWYQQLWEFVKEHPALLAPVLIGLLSLLGDHGDDLAALLLVGAAVGLIVWGLASLWESRTSQWFVWVGSALLIGVAVVVYKLLAHNPKAVGVIELIIAAIGLPVAVLALRDKGVVGIAPAIGTAISCARGVDKLRSAAKAAPEPAKEAEVPPKPKRARKKVASGKTS